MDKVRADKLREVGDGHDGTWVAHPGLVPSPRRSSTSTCRSQPDRPKREDVHVTRRGSADVPEGTITEAGLRQNIDVGVQYLEAWLRGIGCVPILQPDGGRRDRRDLPRPGVAVGASRRQSSNDGRPVTNELVARIVGEENDKVTARDGRRALRRVAYEDAAQLMIELVDRSRRSRSS